MMLFVVCTEFSAKLQRSLDPKGKNSGSMPILNCLDFLNGLESTIEKKSLVSNVDSFVENQSLLIQHHFC
jgi:hypothetical protein